jgi:hypothetical protein
MLVLVLGDEPPPPPAATGMSQVQQLQEAEQEVQRLTAQQKQLMAKYGKVKVRQGQYTPSQFLYVIELACCTHKCPLK